MRRPPQCVAVVARHHWLTGGAMIFSLAVLYGFTRHLPGLELGPKGYVITLTLAALYVATGTLVWFGVPLGRFLNYACSLVYLARPQLGLRIWRIMDSLEFKTYFSNRTGMDSEARKP